MNDSIVAVVFLVPGLLDPRYSPLFVLYTEEMYSS